MPSLEPMTAPTSRSGSSLSPKRVSQNPAAAWRKAGIPS